MKSKYYFPAVFEKEDSGYSVSFPDLKGCVTSGKTQNEAFQMAEDALALFLYSMEADGDHIPSPAQISKIEVPKNGFVAIVSCDTMEYRKMFCNKSVKKTLTIPLWLNDMAEKQGINFSQVLQNALKTNLGINK